MRYFLLFFYLFCGLSLQAQGSKPLKIWAAELAGKHSQTALQTLSNQMVRSAIDSNAHNYLTNQLLHAAQDPSIFLEIRSLEPLTLSQTGPIYERYEQTLHNFADLKKQMNSFLYYQTLPSEKRSISLAEKGHLLEQILPLYTSLRKLRTQIHKDPPLEDAYRYIRFALEVVDPALLQGLQAQEKNYLKDGSKVDKKSFCLYPSEGISVLNPSADLEGKFFAIVNDNTSILEMFELWFDLGVLFPDAKLHTNGNMSQFLLWFKSLPKKPDIIFTDIQLGDGTGHYLLHQLRKSGYTGGIVALTSYEETEKNIQLLAAQGFDGFISLQASSLTKIPLAQRITQAAQVYLKQKQIVK